jgi:colicin import membrane protein
MSATLTYEPFRLPAGILAFAVHAIFFVLLYFGFSWQTLPPATMSVELWQSLPEEPSAAPVKPVESLAPVVEAAAKPVPAEMVVKPDIVLPDKKNIVAKQPDAPKPSEKKVVTKSAAQKLIEQKQAEQKQIEQKQAEQKQAELNAAAHIAEQQAAREQASREQAAREQAEKAALTGRIVDEYKAKIKAKITRNIVMPPNVPKDVRAEFAVTLLPGGGVLNTKLIKSSGNTAYDNAVERAIIKSDPLPLPPDPALFNRFRELGLSFVPDK